MTLRTDGRDGWDEFLASGDGVDPAEIDARADAVGADDLSDILFTSGTTGNPKGVMETHGATLRAYQAWSDVVGLRAGDRYLIVNPFFHAFGYKAGWLAAMLTGATIHPQAVFDVDAVLERVAREHITMLPGPPTLFHTILDHPRRADHDLSSLRLAVTGAAAIPVELILRMRDELTFETIITGYGLTESCGIATMCRFDDDPETIATTSGRAIPDVEVLVVADDGREVPRGDPGEVVVRGYNVMRGYLDDPSETAATIDDDGWLHTGDVGVMDERGYLRITDRTKDMFIVGGFNAYPAEIENLLLRNPAIAQVAVIGVPDARMGEVGMAFVVLRPDATASGDEIMAWSRDVMANFKAPRASRSSVSSHSTRRGRSSRPSCGRARRCGKPAREPHRRRAGSSAGPFRDQMTRTPYIGGLRIVVEEWSPDGARLRLPFAEHLTNDGTAYHGGVVASLVDTAGAAAVWAGHDYDKGMRAATVSLTVNYIGAGRGTDLVADAVCVKRGRDLNFSEIRVTDTEGRGVATATLVYRIVP